MVSERSISDTGIENCITNWLTKATIDQGTLSQWINQGFPAEIGLTPRNIEAIKLQYKNPASSLRELVSMPEGGKKVTAHLKKSAYRIKNYINSHNK